MNMINIIFVLQKSHNIRTIIVDNNSGSSVEIEDIIVHFKNNFSCLAVEAKLEEEKCLGKEKKLIVGPYEENKEIGVLKIFPRAASLENGS